MTQNQKTNLYAKLDQPIMPLKIDVIFRKYGNADDDVINSKLLFFKKNIW